VNKKDRLQNLKSIFSDTNITEENFVNTAGKFIDLAAELKDTGEINFAIDLLEGRKSEIAIQENKCLLHYFLSVAYGVVIEQTIAKTNKDWDWEQEVIEKELENLRLAHQNVSKQTDHQIISFMLINLANRFDNLGRFALSLDFWNKALEYNTNLGMAAVNKANSLMYYGRNYLNDVKYQIAFTQIAWQYFKIGLAKPLFRGVADKVKQRLAFMETNYRPALDYKLDRADLILEYDDFEYVKWCTENGLWLNPLSNINSKLECNKDDLRLIHNNHEFTCFFDTIRKDYMFYRKQFFNSLILDNEQGEQLKKSAFKEAYSIFDKIAYLINGIFGFHEIDNVRLNFSRMWYIKLEKNKGLNPVLIEKRNLMLRGLYWASKDIYLNEDGFKNMIEPKAKEINTIRNFVEHKSFKFGVDRGQKFTLQMTITDFDEHLLKLLKLVRETLIYSAYSTSKND